MDTNLSVAHGAGAGFATRERTLTSEDDPPAVDNDIEQFGRDRPVLSDWRGGDERQEFSRKQVYRRSWKLRKCRGPKLGKTGGAFDAGH